MEYWMRLCGLEKKTPDGVKMQQSWIPEEFAKTGKFLKLKEGDQWEDGWKVTFVGSRRTSKEVDERSRDHKTHRQGSDI